MNSLRLRLVGFTLFAVGIVWLATAILVWRQAHHEFDEIVAELPAAAQAALAGEHHELVEEIAEHMAKPVVVAFPLLALLLVVAVTLALRPLKRLAGEVAERAPDHLAPLPTDGAPSEVRPLIARLNQLFADIDRALDNERRFTADAAHELRTPLAAIKAQAQVALGADDIAARHHALTQIVAGCDRATHLAEQLLMLARLDAPRVSGLVELDLAELAARVLADTADAAIRRGSNLSLVDAGQAVHGPKVKGDPALLEVLLRNLLANSLVHTPPGSEIDVTVGWFDGAAELRVADNGPGIPADQRQTVIQRFRRASESLGDGSGLGLSIVSRIAQLHGATFALESAEGGRGTRARLRFPPTS